MIISLEDIEKVKKHESKFVSLKYIDLLGNLQQLDMHYQHFIGNDITGLLLKPLKIISNKTFSDPFRSFPTTSFLCENLEANLNIRTKAAHLINQNILDSYQNISIFIHFWIENKDQPDTINNNLLIADPFDKYANLRSDITQCLENIGIKTSLHYHGSEYNECIIGIGGDGILDLADNVILSKFIIANVAYSYGQNVKFSNKNNYNIELNIRLDQNLYDQFAHNILNNSGKIAVLFRPASSDLLNINLINSEYQNAPKNPKVLLKTGNIFNPYLAITALIGYCVIKNFSLDPLLDELVLNNYMNGILTN